MKILIRFQDNDAFDPIVVDGDWLLAEHLLQQYGDEHQFVPSSRMCIINRSGNIFISYVGTLAKDGTGAILYMTNAIECYGFNMIDQAIDDQWQHYTIEDVEEDLSHYIMDKEYCSEEDWRDQ